MHVFLGFNDLKFGTWQFLGSLITNSSMSVKLAPQYQHFLNFMRVLTLFAIVVEFLIGLDKSSGFLMNKKCDFRNAEITSRISTLSEKQIFSQFRERFSIVLKFRTLFRNSSCKLREIWLLKISTFFQNVIFEKK